MRLHTRETCRREAKKKMKKKNVENVRTESKTISCVRMNEYMKHNGR